MKHRKKLGCRTIISEYHGPDNHPQKYIAISVTFLNLVRISALLHLLKAPDNICKLYCLSVVCILLTKLKLDHTAVWRCVHWVQKICGQL